MFCTIKQVYVNVTLTLEFSVSALTDNILESEQKIDSNVTKMINTDHGVIWQCKSGIEKRLKADKHRFMNVNVLIRS